VNNEEYQNRLKTALTSVDFGITFLTEWQQHTLDQLTSLGKQKAAIEHPRHKGDSREDDFVRILRKILPSAVETAKGIVVNELGSKSAEQDCLLLNRALAAKLYVQDEQLYHSIESVLGSIEIKSKLNLSELRKIALNCISLKKLPYSFGVYDPAKENEPVRPMGYFVFLYDSEWDSKTTCERINTILKDIPIPLRPNMFYLLNEGVFMPSQEGEFRITHHQIFEKGDFHYFGEISTHNLKESKSRSFLWFTSFIIDHCIEELSKISHPWYARYLFSPLTTQAMLESGLRKIKEINQENNP